MSSENENVDYRETLNVTRVHSAAAREKIRLSARKEPLPLWVFVGSSLVIMLGGGFLGANAAGFSMSTFLRPGYQPTGPEGAVAATTEEGGDWLPGWIKAGEKVYKGKGACIGCHQASGTGVPGQYPPLAGSEWVLRGDERIAMLVIHGLSGPIVVEGQPYNGQMPAQGITLSDKEIAQVISYIRNTWGNNASFVTEEKIAHARQKYADHVGAMTQETLEQVPADQMLPGAEVDPVTGQPVGADATGGDEEGAPEAATGGDQA